LKCEGKKGGLVLRARGKVLVAELGEKPPEADTTFGKKICHSAGADLGFYKGGCPIHVKGAPKGGKPPTCAAKARLRRGCGGLLQKI